MFFNQLEDFFTLSETRKPFPSLKPTKYNQHLSYQTQIQIQSLKTVWEIPQLAHRDLLWTNFLTLQQNSTLDLIYNLMEMMIRSSNFLPLIDLSISLKPCMVDGCSLDHYAEDGFKILLLEVIPTKAHYPSNNSLLMKDIYIFNAFYFQCRTLKKFITFIQILWVKEHWKNKCSLFSM
jgi:hypothetical protein